MARRPNLKRRQTFGHISTAGMSDPSTILAPRLHRRQSVATIGLPSFAKNRDDDAKGLEKQTSLAWRVLSNSQMQELIPLTAEELQKKLAVILDLPDHDTILQDAAVLDFYVSGFWWGKEQGWNEQQISGLVTVHHILIENIKANKLSLQENLTELKKMLVGIGTKDEQNGGLDFLDVTMATSLVKFLSSTFFQHYRLYEFLFNGERTEQVISTDLEVELVPPANLPHPPPLDEALPEDIYRRHVAPQSSESRASVMTTEEDLEVATEEAIETESKTGEPAVEDANDAEEEVGDILAGVTAEEVQTVFDRVSRELFSSLQNHVALKLKERESEIISRINKIHRILDR
ncbi:ciliary-associated calcium-binding coiled-coil protein 1-like isoform X1 [Apostichopus japonicus]|uniref:ciliary-associated calcium-binding coiled-coil protein 1-like isoform X1 n=1 Tax=Stichopus japonicus TaxID=307972 RepID=UPI003AB60FA1